MKRLPFLGVVLIVLILWSLGSAWWSWQAVSSARAYDLTAAAKKAKLAQPLSQTLSVVTLRKIPLIETWRLGLQTLIHLGVSARHTQQYSSQLWLPPVEADPKIVTQWLESLTILHQDLRELSGQMQQTPSLSRRVELVNYLSLLEHSAEFIGFLSHLIQGKKTYLILLQNTDELRPTGGFMGSYIRLTLAHGLIEHMKLEDIYVPDGQFTGYVEAPPGVAEYLSGGNGMRLPDANWNPDFPSSAQQILSYFALGEEQAAEGVMAFNLEVAEELLRITGDVFLPDYQITVTPENLSEVARADRSEFFPGSQQKKNFLTHLLTQLKLKTNHLSPHQQQQLVALVLRSLQNKNIQFFSTNPELQKTAATLGIGGTLTKVPNPSSPSIHLRRLTTNSFAAPASTNTKPTTANPKLALAVVEANVGINKANQSIERHYELRVGATETQLTTTWQVSQLHYVNYQRLFLLPETKLELLAINGQPMTEWKQTAVTTQGGEHFTQIGFLVPMPPNTATTLTATISHAPLDPEDSIWLPKQSGVPTTPLTIFFGDQVITTLHEQDTLLVL